MQPHSSSTQARRSAAQAPSDPASITRQVFATARPYDAFPVYAASTSLDCSPEPGQPFTSCFGSIAPIAPIPFTLNALDRPIRPVKPYAPSPGINHGFVRPARHPLDLSLQSGVNSSDAVQIQNRQLLQNAQNRGRIQQNTVLKGRRKSNTKSGRSPFHVVDVGRISGTSKARNDSPLPNPGSLSSLTSPIRFKKSRPCTQATNDASSSKPGPQPSQNESPVSCQSSGYLWLEYGQRDPTVRSLHARSTEDNDRMDAIQGKGGACIPCRRSKKRCDALDYCQGCIHRGIPSEKQFLTSIQPASQPPNLEDISLYNIQSPTLLNNRSLAETDSSAMMVARRQPTNHLNDHVNAWFKRITRMIDPKPFYNGIFQREVSLGITSGPNGERSTGFNLEFLDISGHLEQTAYLLQDEESLLAAFLGHSSAPNPPAPSHGQSRSQCIRYLSWVVSHIFAFLRSFADADIYAAINSGPAARASVSIVYASFYRLLLAKSGDLCSFVLRSLQQDFHYCTRRSFNDIIEDSLRGLAAHHRVVTALASPELGSSSEVAALFSGLRDPAASLLQHRGIEALFLRIYAKIKPEPRRTLNNTTQSMFKELISPYCAKLPEIKPLSIALRVNSGNGNIAPVPTEAFRDTDPYHHHRHIKVRDLLKETEGSVVDPKQIYVDDIVDNFDFLGRPPLKQPGPSDSCLNSTVGLEIPSDAGYVVPQSLSTSLDPEHPSIPPSQQDTETESIKSESTIQNDLDFDHYRIIGPCSEKEPKDHVWRDVPLGKGCKRRERSGDSQNSRQSSGRGNRKHIKLDPGRESPPPYKYNYFDVLIDEPTRLP